MTQIDPIEIEMTQEIEAQTWSQLASFEPLTDDAICIDNQWSE